MIKTQNAVEKAASLLIEIRGNCTTLEIKKYLRADGWKIRQQEVSDAMAQMDGVVYTDNGKFRTYELAPSKVVAKKANKVRKVRVKKASRSAMVTLMENAGGKFITVTFEKKNGDVRVMNCKVDTNIFMNSQGYINVNEGGNYRQVNPRTILGLKIAGKHYGLK